MVMFFLLGEDKPSLTGSHLKRFMGDVACHGVDARGPTRPLRVSGVTHSTYVALQVRLVLTTANRSTSQGFQWWLTPPTLNCKWSAAVSSHYSRPLDLSGFSGVTPSTYIALQVSCCCFLVATAGRHGLCSSSAGIQFHIIHSAVSDIVGNVATLRSLDADTLSVWQRQTMIWCDHAIIK